MSKNKKKPSLGTSPKVGIKNLKVIIGFNLSVGEELAKALEDGQFSFSEVLGFTDELMEIPKVVEAVKKAPEEFKDLDEKEAAELKEYFCIEFDIANDKVEAAIEASFKFAIAIAEFAFSMAEIFIPKEK